MKQVIAIIRPYLAERLLENLRLSPLEALQVTEVKGFGRQKSYLDQYLATEYSLAFLPKVEITLYVADIRVEEVLKTIIDTARSGRMGDGKIWFWMSPRAASEPFLVRTTFRNQRVALHLLVQREPGPRVSTTEAIADAI